MATLRQSTLQRYLSAPNIDCGSGSGPFTPPTRASKMRLTSLLAIAAGFAGAYALEAGPYAQCMCSRAIYSWFRTQIDALHL